MDAIEKRARDLLISHYSASGFQHGDPLSASDANSVAVKAIAAALTPPEEPDHALLVSMAMCLDQGFGLLRPEQQKSQLREMRKLWDEVMGRGYYSPDNRERYVAMLAARPKVS
ncbi:hypothetical protein [Stenotrophomonas forensis]|uniref:hypothetical protein n=1 Tax=Stenotrophomonas forensis TaxID=2871169 RepID=UPI0039C5C549